MSIRAVLFDMDGTLYVAPYNWPEIRQKLGVKGRLILEHFRKLSPEERQEKERLLLRMEWEATLRGRLREGAREFLLELKRAGKKLAVVTNNARKVVDYIIEKHRLPFDVVVSREDGSFKPYPEPVRQALERLGERAEDSIFVGDNDLDIMAALPFPFPFILILNPDPSPFREKFSDERILYFPRFSELTSFILRRFL